MTERTHDKVRELVRENYGQVAKSGGAGCGCAPACCSPDNPAPAEDASLALGYSREDVTSVPEGANMGLGCGNPQAIASLLPGETVLDLGSGGGFDCLLAARTVGPQGHVIGVDMTPEMVAKARRNAEKAGLRHAEFRLGEIEHLPVADCTIDVIMSNCVINLSPEKEQVYREAWRVLRPGGRLAISDIVATLELPDEVKNDPTLYAGCMAGASVIDEIESVFARIGFQAIRITPKDGSQALIREWTPDRNIADFLVSATIEAVKPSAGPTVNGSTIRRPDPVA
ncbi:MAG: arsenite methyltransferase [Nitrospirota bacterium]